jgi:hypothetical protein
MRTSRSPRGTGPATLSALLRASHLLGLAFGSALGRLRDSGPLLRVCSKGPRRAPCSLGWRARGGRDFRDALGQGPEAPAPALPTRGALPDPAYQKFPRPVSTRDGGDGFPVPGRLPRCGTTAASSRSKSSLREFLRCLHARTRRPTFPPRAVIKAQGASSRCVWRSPW